MVNKPVDEPKLCFRIFIVHRCLSPRNESISAETAILKIERNYRSCQRQRTYSGAHTSPNRVNALSQSGIEQLTRTKDTTTLMAIFIRFLWAKLPLLQRVKSLSFFLFTAIQTTRNIGRGCVPPTTSGLQAER